MTNDRTKKCRFCGHDAFVFRDNRGYWLAGCFNNLVCDVTPKSEQLTRDLAVEKWNKSPSPWHTGTPTEEGWYLLYGIDGEYHVCEIREFTNFDKLFLAWQKIEPYKEKEDGRTD